MKILAVDDERAALNILTRAISEALPEAQLTRAQSVEEAQAALAATPGGFAVAFIDIALQGGGRHRPWAGAPDANAISADQCCVCDGPRAICRAGICALPQRLYA